nr:hypothetical protein [Tanacetum cinerariifolium]
MDMTIDQQVALKEALIPHAHRLRIGRSNFRLLSDISSEKSTFQLVYDVLRLTLFFKAFLVTADIPEIYMQEFWATATVHHHSIRFKMDNKKHIVNLEYFREMLHICPRLPDDDDQDEGDDDDDQEEGNDDDQDSDKEGDDGNDDEEGSDEQDNDDAQDDDDDQDDENKDDDDQDEGDDDDDQEEGNDDDQDSDEKGKEFIHPRISVHDEEETRDEESFDPIPKTPENINDEGNGEENLGLNVGRKEGKDEEDDADELYRDVNINLEGRGIESIFETTFQMDAQASTSVASLPVSAPTLTPSTIATITTVQQAPTPLTTVQAHSYKIYQTLAHFKVAVQIQFDRLRDEAQAVNEEFLKTIDENMQKIIKEQVKEQVKVQVSKILPKIEQTMNEQLEAEVLTRSSNSSKTSYAVAADLSEIELKKILIEKIEGNKSIHRSNEQRNLYKALVKAYESDKIILDIYGDTFMLKRRRDDDAYKDEEPSARSDRGSKRRREGKKPESASVPKEKATRSAGKSTQGSKSRQTESARDVYSKRRIIAVTELKIVEWHNYKHLDWITVRRDDDKLYKFKEGDFKGLRIQDIEDMLLLLVQGKLTNLTVEECFAFNVSLRMFTRSIVIQRRVEDLQLSVESYQKKLNLTRPDTYRSDLKRKEAYIAYSNPRGFIYQNKDKQNRLMRIDELHKFSDGTLTDVRTALDDRLKRIRMKYLPQTIWRKSDKERAAAMIQAINKQLKTKRIMRSLERFVGGRLYEGDFKMLQQTM